MACPGDGKCRPREKLELRDCERRTAADATFVVDRARTSHGHEGHTFRVANTDLCLQRMGRRGRAVRLRRCRAGRAAQVFAGFDAEARRFDLRPVEFAERCLTNHHHPKEGETIFAETCQKAHKTNTGYWVAY